MIPQIPQSGQTIRAFFRNSTKIEGIVLQWSEEKSIIKSLDGTSILIIQKTAEDIMAIEIILSPPDSEQNNFPKSSTSLEEQFQQVYQQSNNNNSRLPRLVKLKTMINTQERQKLAAFLKAGKKAEDKYELPGFLKMPTAK